MIRTLRNHGNNADADVEVEGYAKGMNNYPIGPNRTPPDPNICHFTGAHYT